jgi:hypothetical protein
VTIKLRYCPKNLPEGTEENDVEYLSGYGVPGEIQIEYLSNTVLEHYR